MELEAFMEPTDPRLDSLIHAHEGFVRAWAIQLAPAPGLADDIMQQVFTEFIAKFAQWDLNSDLRPLLLGMVRNVARRSWREKARAMSPEMQALAEHIRKIVETQEAAPFCEDEKQALRLCLGQLSPRSRKLVELHYDLGVPAVDLASQVAMTADAVRRALFRIRLTLRECIERRIGRVTCG
jgi:RNA polymerase sigma-70 factor, ECF subfamily